MNSGQDPQGRGCSRSGHSQVNFPGAAGGNHLEPGPAAPCRVNAAEGRIYGAGAGNPKDTPRQLEATRRRIRPSVGWQDGCYPESSWSSSPARAPFNCSNTRSMRDWSSSAPMKVQPPLTAASATPLPP